MENYEQKYKDALERARMLNNGKDVDVEAGTTTCEYIFPELKESEDEKIRKWLFNYVGNCPNENFEFYGGVGKKAVLAYLEKQKEQKLLEYLPKEKVYDIMSKLTNLSLSYNIPIEEYEKIDEIKSNVRDLLDYPIEQKPAKWSEEDEKIRKELAEFINHYRHNNDLTSEQAEWCHKALTWIEKQKEQKPVEKENTLTDFEKVLNIFLFDFANSPIEDCDPKEYIKKHSAEILKAAYKELNAELQQDIFEAIQEGRREGYEVAKAEQKPEEWSEEDETRLTNTLIMLKEYAIHHYSKDDVNKSVDWLENRVKLLHPQPKNEWSEEDEKDMAYIIRILDDCYAYGKHDLSKTDHENLVNKLKSLHPQPKQEWSEEDSRILYNVIAYVGYAAGQRGVRDDEFKEANAWLKSLPNGFVINPNYNEDMIKLLIAELRDAAEHNGAPRQYDAEITWLKSLRHQPHTVSIKDATKFGNLEYERGVKDGIQHAKNHQWKPSEEQMKALKIAQSFVVDDFSENPTLSEILKALYKQLKKLMEE